jgi:hypothetical protein
MTHKPKFLLRIAAAIQEQLAAADNTAHDIAMPMAAWQLCNLLAHKIEVSRQKGWSLAATRIQQDLRSSFERIQGSLSELHRQLQSWPPTRRWASTRDIYDDLIALHDEFDDVRCDRRGRTISVTTEPITLEEVYLGPFEIHLDWDDLATYGPDNYRVIALDSNPAASDDSVTHPHVQDEVLCAGEGQQPIRQALEQGRLLDFFLIVANLLRTYNAASPYVAISEWHGVRCADCGSTTYDDERWTCDKCETTVCGDCYFNCPGCDRIFCSECVTRCEGCDQLHCNVCIRQCSCCGDDRCKGCLDDEERCADCHDQETEEDEEPVTDASCGEDRTPSTALQPHCMGQAVVPA